MLPKPHSFSNSFPIVNSSYRRLVFRPTAKLTRLTSLKEPESYRFNPDSRTVKKILVKQLSTATAIDKGKLRNRCIINRALLINYRDFYIYFFFFRWSGFDLNTRFYCHAKLICLIFRERIIHRSRFCRKNISTRLRGSKGRQKLFHDFETLRVSRKKTNGKCVQSESSSRFRYL